MGRVSPVRGNLKSPDAASRLKRKRTSGGLCTAATLHICGEAQCSRRTCGDECGGRAWLIRVGMEANNSVVDRGRSHAFSLGSLIESMTESSGGITQREIRSDGVWEVR